MKKFFVKLLIILNLVVLQLGFIVEFNPEIKNQNNNTIKFEIEIGKSKSNKNTLIASKITQSKNNLKMTINYQNPYFVSQNIYFALTWIIKSLS